MNDKIEKPKPRMINTVPEGEGTAMQFKENSPFGRDQITMPETPAELFELVESMITSRQRDLAENAIKIRPEDVMLAVTEIRDAIRQQAQSIHQLTMAIQAMASRNVGGGPGGF